MKNTPNNKESEFSLNNINNFRNKLEINVSEINQIYSKLLIDYFKFITDNFKNKKTSLTRFIIMRGLDTITNVFLNILYYTKNLELTLFHCQKSFYFYVEFVGQICEDDKMFLQLTSRDASTYVYKKTIFEINNETKKKINSPCEDTNLKLKHINIFVNLCKIHLQKTINDSKIEDFNKNIEKVVLIYNKLNINYIANYDKIDVDNLETIEYLMHKLYHDISDINKYYDINILILKKLIKNIGLLHCVKKNLFADDFFNNLNLSSDKFVNWLLS